MTVSCGFCQGQPVGNAASWLDGKPRPPAPCPRCGETNVPDLEPDVVTGENGEQFKLERLVAYQGQEGCHDVRCSQASPYPGRCGGYHCAVCEKPSSMTGHRACQEALDA